MDPLEVVQTTADAAYATDEDGRIVVWNKAAERLFGYNAERVLGKPCHEIVCGSDVFGNRYCDENCNLSKMVLRKEAIRGFELDIRTASGQTLRVTFSVLIIRGPRTSQYTIIHVLRTSRRSEGPKAALAPLRVDDAAATPAHQPALTEREIEVLRFLADGRSAREVADSLCVSVTTIRTHVQNILRKLDVHSQLQAVSVALRNRLI